MPQPELAESSQATSPADQATGAPAGEEVQVLGRSHARSAREVLGRAPLKGLRASALVALAVTLLNWSPWEQIKSGLDPSWQAGIALGFVRHLQWGPALDFTYGPYGFAGFLEPFYRSTALIALLYIFVVTWLLAMLLIEGLRSRWGLAGAGVIAWAVVALSWPVVRAADFASVVGLGLGLAVLETKSRTLRAVLTSLLGGLAGFVVLVKPNTGIVMMGLLALALAGTDVPRRERARIAWQAGGALVAVFVVAWAAAGQSFSNLLVFTRARLFR